jgi:competence protein ComEA
VPRRRRPDPQTAALRLAAVVVAAGPAGWVPPPEVPPTAPDPAAETASPADALAAGRGPLALLRGRLAGAGLEPGRPGVIALAAVGLVAALVAGSVLLRGRPQEVVAPPAVVRAGTPIGGSPSPTGEVVVSVAGTVRRPGLVHLPAGSRVDDAVRAAGGLTGGGQVGLLNLARRLVDGEQVLVGVAAPGGVVPGGAVAGGLVDLNAATADDLDGLPGIGPVLAERIVDWRTEHGRFASVDQLREVPGIGESKYSQVKSKVAV